MEQASAAIIALFLLLGGLGMLVLAVPLYAIWASHRRKMEEIRQRGLQQVDRNTQAQFDAIRAELHQLRDTSTQYDMSLENTLKQMDDSLSRVDQRVSNLERNQTSEPQRNYQSS